MKIDKKYWLELTPTEANEMLWKRLKRCTEQLQRAYNDTPTDNPEETVGAIEIVIAQLQGLKFELELLDRWKKDTLAKLAEKEND